MTFDTNPDERQFAAGENRLDDCYCPAGAAGFVEDGEYGLILTAPEYGQMAYEYDQKIERETGVEIAGVPETGTTVGEDTARNAWLAALEEFDTDTPEYNAGVEVAEELGWL